MRHDGIRGTDRNLTDKAGGAGQRLCLRLLLSFVVFLLLPAAGALTPERASMRAYLYLEPGSARFEVLAPLTEMMTLLGLPPETSLAVEAQERLRDTARQKLSGWLRGTVDGGASPGAASFRVTIVKGVPGRTELLNPGETVSTGEAMLGLAWEYELPAVPEKLGFTWTGFSEQLPSLSVSIIAGLHIEDRELSAGAPSFEWVNGGRLAPNSPLSAVPPLPPVETIRLPVGSMLWALFGLIIFGLQWRRGGRAPGRLLATLAGTLLGAAILWPVASLSVEPPWSGVAPVPPDEAERILTPLLRNVYRAFDGRKEREIYDVLERSIGGDMLEKIYLQTISALTIDAQDSIRVRVSDLAVQVDSVRVEPGRRTFVADVRWTAFGTVGHWGHEHPRVNRYVAKVTVAAVPVGDATSGGGAAWKIVGLDVQEEARI